jgi:uncharacterized protein
MIIRFSEHDDSEISFEHAIDAENINLEDEMVSLTGPIKLTGTARRSSEIARLKGNLCGNLEIACSRCLQPSEFALNANFEADFVTLENYGAASHENELSSTDLSLSVYDGEQIDLNEIAHEQILLNLPMQQLCKEDCAGLCEKCAANKNTNPCDCETKQIDPRWSALKELKSKS